VEGLVLRDPVLLKLLGSKDAIGLSRPAEKVISWTPFENDHLSVLINRGDLEVMLDLHHMRYCCRSV